jgi:hypothetical protein
MKNQCGKACRARSQRVTVRYLTLFVALFAAVPVQAGTLEAVALDRIVSVASGDLDGDGAIDAALLIAPGEDEAHDDHALVLLRGTGLDEGALQPWRVYADAAWGGLPGGMVGNRPAVAFTDAGSLQLISKNEAIGRSRWYQTVTLAWRDGDLLVAGFTYDHRDTLDLDAAGGCDVNVFTGRGVVREETTETTVSLEPRRLPLDQWLAQGSPTLCPDG